MLHLIGWRGANTAQWTSVGKRLLWESLCTKSSIKPLKFIGLQIQQNWTNFMCFGMILQIKFFSIETYKIEHYVLQNRQAKPQIQGLNDLLESCSESNVYICWSTFLQNISINPWFKKEYFERHVERKLYFHHPRLHYMKKGALKSRDLMANFNYCRVYQLNFTKLFLVCF